MARVTPKTEKARATVGNWRGSIADLETTLSTIYDRARASCEDCELEASYTRPDGAIVRATGVDDLASALSNEENPSAIAAVSVDIYANRMERIVHLHTGLGAGMTVEAESKDDENVWAFGLATVIQGEFEKNAVPVFQDRPRPLRDGERAFAAFLLAFFAAIVVAIASGWLAWTAALTDIELIALSLLSLSILPKQRRVPNKWFTITDGQVEDEAPATRLRQLPSRVEAWFARHPLIRFLIGVVLVSLILDQISAGISRLWLGE